jgi:hypothetical protein
MYNPQRLKPADADEAFELLESHEGIPDDLTSRRSCILQMGN